MAANQFYPFGIGAGAYVLTNNAYQALAARSSGYPPGLLPKEHLNTALRQANFVAFALSKWGVDTGGLDALDNGTVANYIDMWNAAFSARFRALLAGQFMVYAGNPNGNVAGVQGNTATNPQTFPSVVWDTTNNIWWVCSQTGNAAAAVWYDTSRTTVTNPFPQYVRHDAAQGLAQTNQAQARENIGLGGAAFSATNNPAANVWTAVYTADTDKLMTVRLTNRDSANGISVDLAICPSAYVNGNAPADADYIESKATLLEAAGIIEDYDMNLLSGEKIVVRTSNASLSVEVCGIKSPGVVKASRLAPLANGLWQTAHTVPAGKQQTVLVRTVNLNGASPITIGLAKCQPGYADGAVPSNSDLIEPSGQTIEAAGLIESYLLSAKAGEKIAVFTAAATLAVRVSAIEQ